MVGVKLSSSCCAIRNLAFPSCSLFTNISPQFQKFRVCQFNCHFSASSFFSHRVLWPADTSSRPPGAVCNTSSRRTRGMTFQFWAHLWPSIHIEPFRFIIQTSLSDRSIVFCVYLLPSTNGKHLHHLSSAISGLHLCQLLLFCQTPSYTAFHISAIS